MSSKKAVLIQFQKINYMKNLIIKAVPRDRSFIYSLYLNAIKYQLDHGYPAWNGYNVDLIDQEIHSATLQKIMINGEIAAIFSAGRDGVLEEELWKDKATDKALYLNRIITNPTYKGQRLLGSILDWARNYCRINDLQFIRLDTWADNPQLVNYYLSFGFQNLGTFETSNASDLPLQYRNLQLTIMEIGV
jgi:GNAT superfamily N-acetyltransferase